MLSDDVETFFVFVGFLGAAWAESHVKWTWTMPTFGVARHVMSCLLRITEPRLQFLCVSQKRFCKSVRHSHMVRCARPAVRKWMELYLLTANE